MLRIYFVYLFLLVTCVEVAFGQRAGQLDTTFNYGMGASYRYKKGHGPNNQILVIKRQADGKLLVGGNMTTYNGIPASRIARINTDGNLDPSFNTGTGFNDYISDLVIQSDGKIIVAGNMTRFNGQSCSRIVRLMPNGSLDQTFVPGTGPSSQILSVTQTSGGQILIGGAFTSFSGNSANRIARLNPDGSFDATFNIGTGFNEAVFDVKETTSGQVIVGGNFTAIQGRSKSGLVRLNSDGTHDTTFAPFANNGLRVADMAIDAQGRIIVVGPFSTINNQSRVAIARLDANGQVDTTFKTQRLFSSPTSANFNGIKILSNGDYAVVNAFNFSGSNNGINVGVIRPNGRLDSVSLSWGRQIDKVYAVEQQANGQLVVSGALNSNGFTTQVLMGLSSLGIPDYTFNKLGGTNSSVYSIYEQPDGKLIVCSGAGRYGDKTTYKTFRIFPDGRLDSTFAGPRVNVGTILRFFPLASGKNLAVGDFGIATGRRYEAIVRIDGNGLIDTTFLPLRVDLIPNSAILQALEQPDGKIMICGGFYRLNNRIYNGVARLMPNGALDTTYISVGIATLSQNPGIVRSMALQPDGKLLITGQFVKVGNVTTNTLARLNADGSLDQSFNVGGTGLEVLTTFNTEGGFVIRLLPNGSFYVGGMFRFYNNVASPGLVRILPNGSIDRTFLTTSQLQAYNLILVYDVEVYPNGDVLAVGDFYRHGNTPAAGVVRFKPNGQVDPTFNTTIGADRVVTNAIILSTGQIMLGGFFDNFEGRAAPNLVRIHGSNSVTTLDDALANHTMGLKLVPNPARYQVQVAGLAEGVAQPYQLFNAVGQLITQGSIGVESATISLDGLPRGLYTVATERERLRLVVE